MTDQFEPERNRLKDPQSGGDTCFGLLGVGIANDVVDHGVEPGVGQGEGGGAADAPPRAGDQRNSALAQGRPPVAASASGL